jgi:hypothetical protein
MWVVSALIIGWSLRKTNAADASIFLIFANLDPTKGYKGITCFVAEKEWGVEIAKKEKKVYSLSNRPLIFVARDKSLLYLPSSFRRFVYPKGKSSWTGGPRIQNRNRNVE